MTIYPFKPQVIPQGKITQEHYERIANAIAPDFHAPKVSQMFLGDDLDGLTMDDIYYESLKCLLQIAFGKVTAIDDLDRHLEQRPMTDFLERGSD